MKKLLFTFSFLMFVFFGFTQSNCTISISGMHCAAGCGSKVENGLKSVEGIESVDVNFDKKEAFVVFDENQISEEDIVKFIKQIGFKAKINKIKEDEK